MGYVLWNRRMLVWTRWLLGAQYLLDGVNWWYKMFPFPNLHDPLTAAAKHMVLVEMIRTGWMFQSAKAMEVLTGIALLSNRFVPLALVVSFPVAVTTFGLDAMIWPQVTGFFAGTVGWPVLWAKILDLIFFGGCVLAMQAYLMFGHFDLYRPMLVAKAEPIVP
jgi:hypothetical protein